MNVSWVAPWHESVGAPATRVLALLSSLAPTSVAEWCLGCVLIALGTWTGVAAAWAARGGAASAARSLGLLTGAGAVCAAIFYAIWGANYARPPLADVLGLEDTADDDALVLLAGAFVERTNRAYVEAFGSGDLGVVAPVAERVDEAVDEGLASAVASLGLPGHMGRSHGPHKELRFAGGVVARLGISGFFFPFTGEANVVPGSPPAFRTHVIAHEKAHQRGLASEDEANFLGFVACISSPDPRVRYAGWWFAQRTVLTAISSTRRGEVSALVQVRERGVQRDVDANRRFWAAYQGSASELGHAVNDAYLRLHRVKGGARSYGLSVRLIASWYNESVVRSDR